MSTLIRRRYGRLGLQLALAFVFVAVGAVVAANVVAALTVYADARQLLDRQEADQASAAALGAAATYPQAGTRAAWARALTPVIAVADRSGSAMRVRDMTGQIVRSSPGYGSIPPGLPIRRAPVRAGGRRVGSVTLKFDDRGVGGILSHFEAQRWKARLGAAGFGALVALVVAFFLAPMIAAPVDRLIWTVRARGSGHRDARVGKVRGFRDIRELAATFDQMADNIGQQDQVRREFVANITHELRTPIAVLQASTEAMLDEITEPTADKLESLNEEAIRLGQMVDDLQRLASAEAAAVQLTLSACDLAALAAPAADSLREIFDNAGIRLVRRLTAVYARCDRARMREVVTNLLTNAAKFTPSGGQVVLETCPSGDLAMLRVSDTGVGIPADELPHVSQRFFRGRSAAEVSGSGIGLAIVDELVRGHHGGMVIASQPGQGTQVTIELPSADLTGPAQLLGRKVTGQGSMCAEKVSALVSTRTSTSTATNSPKARPDGRRPQTMIAGKATSAIRAFGGVMIDQRVSAAMPAGNISAPALSSPRTRSNALTENPRNTPPRMPFQMFQAKMRGTSCAGWLSRCRATGNASSARGSLC